ncbi:MAG: ATP-dependent DNA helicase RecG, partial [Betaproteobacteria bacterium]|nr:ATP-dependent DNA helicase RecG [Betaproteobacteria bacterium]
MNRQTPHESERRFKLLGLIRDEDFALHFPLRYEDWTRITPLKEAKDGQSVQCDLQILSVQAPQPGRQTCRLTAADAQGTPLQLSFFKVFPSQLAQWQPGRHIRVQGEIKLGILGLEMAHPSLRLIRRFGEALEKQLTAVYPTTAGLTQWVLRRAVQQALER